MKKEKYLMRNAFYIAFLVFLGACRSTDTENTLSGDRTFTVSFNILGTEYADSAKLSTQASLGKESITNSENQIHSALITPSSVITAELSPALPASKISTNASLKLNSMVAAPGDPLASGIRFRAIAYRQSNGNYHTHQDFTIGQTAVPMILDNGSDYNIVVYSYGNTSLPSISAGEQDNISNSVVNYDDNNRDFMYQNVPFTPANYTNNTLNITLRHKIAQITTVINSFGLGNITNITNGLLTPHYSDAVISLSSGVISGRSTTTSGASLSFPFSAFPGATQTASPVFVNADTGGNLTGTFSADITIAGNTKTISLPTSFKVTPENKSNLTINLVKCGAYIGVNTNPANYKEFMCQNLGATSDINPFSPEAGNHGAKYQWGAQTGETGRYLSQPDDQNNSGAITGWDDTNKADGSWSDSYKTSNDPCPSGYRVPTKAQWQAVIDNNNVERVGTWTDDGNYTTALYFKNPSGIRTLMLPAAGVRYNNDGRRGRTGYSGFYWSSTTSSSSGRTFNFTNNSITGTSIYTKSYGFSIRCISE